ncbi:MAG: hypothetical protein B193_3325, partial [Solidesulfovibrio magneticus str. Maddingley MBC34]
PGGGNPLPAAGGIFLSSLNPYAKPPKHVYFITEYSSMP